MNCSTHNEKIELQIRQKLQKLQKLQKTKWGKQKTKRQQLKPNHIKRKYPN